MDSSYEASLLTIADAYAAAVAVTGGKSLARVATIVVNRGSFFERIRDGGGCSARNLDRLAEYFRDPSNWPDGEIPSPALNALSSIGRPQSDAVAICGRCSEPAEAATIQSCTSVHCPMRQKDAA